MSRENRRPEYGLEVVTTGGTGFGLMAIIVAVARVRDWRHAMIMPDGSLFGATKGQGSPKMQFCAECHGIVAAEQDSLYFIPEEYRVSPR